VVALDDADRHPAPAARERELRRIGETVERVLEGAVSERLRAEPDRLALAGGSIRSSSTMRLVTGSSTTQRCG
jgi:hypothetical protein